MRIPKEKVGYDYSKGFMAHAAPVQLFRFVPGAAAQRRVEVHTGGEQHTPHLHQGLLGRKDELIRRLRSRKPPAEDCCSLSLRRQV